MLDAIIIEQEYRIMWWTRDALRGKYRTDDVTSNIDLNRDLNDDVSIRHSQTSSNPKPASKACKIGRAMKMLTTEILLLHENIRYRNTRTLSIYFYKGPFHLAWSPKFNC